MTIVTTSASVSYIGDIVDYFHFGRFSRCKSDTISLSVFSILKGEDPKMFHSHSIKKGQDN